MHDFVVGLIDIAFTLPYFGPLLALLAVLFFLNWAFNGGSSEGDDE